MIEQAQRAPQTVNSDWQPVAGMPIHGVRIVEVKNVITRNGLVRELFRPEWFDPPFAVVHTSYATLQPGRATAWHCHRKQADIFCAVSGQFRIGLYDDRADSPSYRRGTLVHASPLRPFQMYIPAGVWHAFKNIHEGESAYVILNDTNYDYEQPDDWIVSERAVDFPVSLD